MNELRLIARFDAVPPPDQQRHVEAELRAFLLELTPVDDLHVRSGTGSWWIALWGVVATGAGWLVIQAGSWAAKRVFDRIYEKLSGTASRGDPELPPGVEGPEDIPVDEEVALLRTMILASNMKAIAERLGVRQITLAEWSQEEQKGRILAIDDNGLILMQTDSIDEFNIRTGFP